MLKYYEISLTSVIIFHLLFSNTDPCDGVRLNISLLCKYLIIEKPLYTFST